ncbi:TIGR04222 domain-containing membrane protein [Gordonia sp. LSe1-13]|uniref:TIGR04222 domain-containing membrane protein n=1 Tax=Gordonia sesuvii TaxID=3116777 RepID=A0ABU7ME99_9ACTN|nr:TIGR04222 domain-containing membrane protein [Gordonia sp. LSe1-13]
MSTSSVWGIPGPLLVIIVVGLSALALGWIVLSGRRLRDDDDRPLDELSPTELGMLLSDHHAILTALVELRTEGLINVAGRKRRPTAVEVHSLDPLSRNIYGRLAPLSAQPRPRRSTFGGPIRRKRRSVVRRDTRVLLEPLRADLTDRGYLVRNLGPRAYLPLCAVAAFGVVCIWQSIVNEQTPSPGAAGIIGAVLLVDLALALEIRSRRRRRTVRGEQALGLAEAEHEHLDPSLHPAIETYGKRAAAIGSALFGLALVHQFDPAFAKAAGATWIHGGAPATAGIAVTCGTWGGGDSCGGGGGGCGS